MLPRAGAVRVIHLINRGEQIEAQSKADECSRARVDGLVGRVGRYARRRSQWLERSYTEQGIATFDLSDPNGPAVRGG